MYPPPPPPWEGLHPLVIHFPIGLLLFAPLFVLLAMLAGRRGAWFSFTALILLAAGTTGAMVAVSTGEAARDMVEDGPDDMWDVLDEHEEVADQSQKAFGALTLVYLGIFLAPRFFGRLNTAKFLFPANAVFLVLLMGAGILLANTGHLGGRLVHQYGVRAVLAETEAVDEEEEADEDAEEADEVMEDTDAEDADEPTTDEPTTDEPTTDEPAAKSAPDAGEPKAGTGDADAPTAESTTEADGSEGQTDSDSPPDAAADADNPERDE